jgi:hypothetical protein
MPKSVFIPRLTGGLFAPNSGVLVRPGGLFGFGLFLLGVSASSTTEAHNQSSILLSDYVAANRSR